MIPIVHRVLSFLNGQMGQFYFILFSWKAEALVKQVVLLLSVHYWWCYSGRGQQYNELWAENKTDGKVNWTIDYSSSVVVSAVWNCVCVFHFCISDFKGQSFFTTRKRSWVLHAFKLLVQLALCTPLISTSSTSVASSVKQWTPSGRARKMSSDNQSIWCHFIRSAFHAICMCFPKSHF